MFRALKVWLCAEVVNAGVPLTEVAPATHLSPTEWHEKMEEADLGTVLLDARNVYETRVGVFEAQKTTTVDPGLRTFTEFPDWLKANAAELRGKTVLTYCTGGVRCERSSGLIRSLVGDDVTVYQLAGGISRYLQAFPDGGFFKGKNYVFDKRRLEGPSAANTRSSCFVCAAPWDDHKGKRKCSSCKIPVLVCTLCQSRGDDRRFELLCELCDPTSRRYKKPRCDDASGEKPPPPPALPASERTLGELPVTASATAPPTQSATT